MDRRTRAYRSGIPNRPEAKLSIDHPLVYRLRVFNERGATWVDDGQVVWLCAVRRREDGSDDAFAWFSELHRARKLLPTDGDVPRDRAEKAVRPHRRLRSDLYQLTDEALREPEKELWADLGGWLPSRVITSIDQGITEIWCAIACGPWTATTGLPVRTEGGGASLLIAGRRSEVGVPQRP